MEHLAPIATAVLTALGAWLATFLTYRHRIRKQRDASQDTHLETFYQTMNSALREQESRHSKAIDELRLEQREERSQWASERRELQDKVDNYLNALHKKELEVVELRAEVRVLNQRLDQVTTKKRTVKEVTVKEQAA